MDFIFAKSAGGGKKPIGFGPRASGSTPPPQRTVTQGQLPFGQNAPPPPDPQAVKLPSGIARGRTERQRVVSALQAVGWELLPARSIEVKTERSTVVIPKASPGCSILICKGTLGEIGEYSFKVWNATSGTRGSARSFSLTRLALALDECLNKGSFAPFLKVLGG